MPIHNLARVKRLLRIDASSEAIQAQSLYMLAHHAEAKACAEDWVAALHSAAKDTVLPLIYLGNDIVQRAQLKNQRSLIVEFGEVSSARSDFAAFRGELWLSARRCFTRRSSLRIGELRMCCPRSTG
jgi:hypothetical protein